MADRAQADTETLDHFVIQGDRYLTRLMAIGDRVRRHRIGVEGALGPLGGPSAQSAVDSLIGAVGASNRHVADVSGRLRVGRVPDDLVPRRSTGPATDPPFRSSGAPAPFTTVGDPVPEHGCTVHTIIAGGVPTAHLSCPPPDPGSHTEIYPIVPPVGRADTQPEAPDLGERSEIFPVLPPIDETEVFPEPDPRLVREVLGTPPAPETGTRDRSSPEEGDPASSHPAGQRPPTPPQDPRLARLQAAERRKINDRISRQKQGRHLKDDPLYGDGGYFNDAADAQAVLDAYHDGSAQVLGRNRGGHIVVRVPSVRGFNNNRRAGYVDQPTDVFLIKGTTSPSVVPTNPHWRPT